MSFVQILALAGYLAFGLAVGGVYFATLWWNAQLFAERGRVALAITLVAGRFAVILAALGLVAVRVGAWPLLATALGIVLARMAAVRRVNALAR
ncbi:MAG: ATP synthase subunit I [Croceibacterium sp.]